jgi:hypothetical protein
MAERSVLKVRLRPHIHPDRQAEEIWEVWRGGKLVASIYGSREGIHIVSDRVLECPPFRFMVGGMPSLVVPLIEEGESCPWCSGGAVIENCPICELRKKKSESG